MMSKATCTLFFAIVMVAGCAPRPQADTEPAPSAPVLYFDLAIPRPFQSELLGWKDDTPGYRRYADGFEDGWWMCVQNYIDDIGYQSKPIDAIANGHGEFVDGFSNGYWNADRQIQWNIKTFGPERTHAYLVDITATIMDKL
jgi:hypothetical protein